MLPAYLMLAFFKPLRLLQMHACELTGEQKQVSALWAQQTDFCFVRFDVRLPWKCPASCKGKVLELHKELLML